ncbi:MAG: GNAT family N-acetyltransferase [Alphaproteobacteria bacterium]
MVALRPASPADIPAIVDFLHDHMDRRISQARWRRIVEYDWPGAKPTCGWLVEDGDDIVGYLGLVYAPRIIDGADHCLVNLTSWYLRRPYRDLKTALAMLRAATADEDATYTVFSSRPAVTRLMRRAGFRCLDDTRFIWRLSDAGAGNLEVSTDPATIRSGLSPPARLLFDDHATFDATPYLLRAPSGETCFLLMSIRRKGAGIAYHEALYMSDPSVFAPYAQQFADLILPAEQALVALDCRFLDGQEVTAETEPIPAPRFFKSSRLQPSQVDFLYSEILLLNHKLD